jgi:hypothetical protein
VSRRAQRVGDVGTFTGASIRIAHQKWVSALFRLVLESQPLGDALGRTSSVHHDSGRRCKSRNLLVGGITK